MSFFSFGIDASATNKFEGVTSTESELKLFELKLKSSKALKPDRSLGRVQKSFEAISNTLS